MDGFDRLLPAVQHHVVDTLHWPVLRPLQEAATLPLLSRAAGDGPGDLYVCRLRAVLSNLEHRLDEKPARTHG